MSNKSKFNKKYAMIITSILVIVFFVFLYFFNYKSEIAYESGAYSIQSYDYEKARIIKVLEEDIKEDESVKGLYRGTQTLEIKLTSGKYKGEIHTVENYLTATQSIYCKEGNKIIAVIDTASDGSYMISVYNYYREPIIYGFILLFFLAIILIGRSKGLKSVLGILFTFICIIFLLIPMILKGYSCILSSIVFAIVSSCITLILLNGFSRKTLCAILGTTIGVIISGIIFNIAGTLTHLSGLNLPEVENFILMSRNMGLEIKEILFAAVLIASLGAVMDVAMSIASAINEIYNTDKSLSSKKLFISGMNVGKDMMGTMSNTLLLAFTGASMSSLIMIFSYNTSYNQMINMDMLAIEIIQGISGSLAIILTVPIIAFISSVIIPNNK